MPLKQKQKTKNTKLIMALALVGIFTLAAGYFYYSHRVSVELPVGQADGQPAGSTMTLLAQWGAKGAGDGKFNVPQGIAVDSQGNVYVADTMNHRVQKFDPWGNLITKGYVQSSRSDLPTNVAIDPTSGYVYTTERQNSLVRKFDASGKFMTNWAVSGRLGLPGPYGIAVDKAGNFYVAEQPYSRVDKFSADGKLIEGTHFSASNPYGVALDKDGNGYVTSGNYIRKFAPDGTPIDRWGTKNGTAGAGNGEFNKPQGIAADSQGNIYVADTGNNRIQELDASGKFLLKWGTSGSGDNQFNSPQGVAVDQSGNVYVIDTNNNRVQKFAASKFIDTYDSIHAFLTWDYFITDFATAAKHADFVWGADKNNIGAWRRATNKPILLSAYIPFTRDPDNWHNGYSSRSDNLAYWNSTHPDWVLYKCDKTTPAWEFEDTNVPLDISNPAVVDWQIANFAVPAAKAGYDLIAADNFELYNAFGACGVWLNNHTTWKALYIGNTAPDLSKDPKYTADVLTWAQTFAAKLHALSPKPLGLVPNFSIQDLPYNDPNVVKLVSYVDAILDESGYTDFGNIHGYPDAFIGESRWNNIENFVNSVQLQHKAYFSINYLDTDTRPLPNADIQWVLASYLMSKGHTSAISIFPTGPEQTGNDNWRKEYEAPIGSPCGAMQSKQGLYVREYMHGYAITNPTANKVSFTLPSGSFQDLYGGTVNGSVQMAKYTGLVLIDKGGPRCSSSP